jgi:protein MpaA
MKSRYTKILNKQLALIAFLFLSTGLYAAEPAHKLTPAHINFCKKIETHFKKYGWEKADCENYDWISYRNSVQGEPLTWTVFGDATDEEKPTFKKKDVSFIMCGVHGDEITPIKFCFDIMGYLKTVYADPEYQKEFANKIVIVAPLVNPDSFFKARPTRVNARGIDVNRNFPTKDWTRDARKLWISHFRKDKRRNPGVSASSEPEVVFQMNLIKRYGPDKIISVHSPLTMLDYDGPNTIVDGFVDGAKAHELLIQMSKDASDYKIENYPFFPGSLGNWAGKERDIPTYTLELPTSDPAKSSQYWKLFKSAIHNAIAHDLKDQGSKPVVPATEVKPAVTNSPDPASSEVANAKNQLIN